MQAYFGKRTLSSSSRIGFSKQRNHGWGEIEISTKGVVDRREEGGGRGRGKEKYACPQSLSFWETPFVGERSF